MMSHINNLTWKYFIETSLWNKSHTHKPQTYEESYINAEGFLKLIGVKMLYQNVKDFRNRLSPSEIAFIKSMIYDRFE